MPASESKHGSILKLSSQEGELPLRMIMVLGKGLSLAVAILLWWARAEGWRTLHARRG
jgi:hypothetical protein